MILLGVFESKAAIAVVAFAGVAMASVYTLRLFIRAMHNRQAEGAASREISVRDGLVLVPLVLAILALSIYPQLPLKRSEGAVRATVAPAKAAAQPTREASR
jgi:NADH-quinone oxidoreductase subunit M